MGDWNHVNGYLIRPELQYAVEAALTLNKPLLLRGEPGTGKTGLAQAAAQALQRPLLVWNLKSDAKANQGLYQYDGVRRLYDSQLLRAAVPGRPRPKDLTAYLHLGQLGQAFVSHEPVVLLIDGIDKADLDFPGDLLWELERGQFQIAETGAVIQARHPPLVLLTSNGEKELPAAFLRRCLFYVIPFPENACHPLRPHRTGCAAAGTVRPSVGGILLDPLPDHTAKEARYLRAAGLAPRPGSDWGRAGWAALSGDAAEAGGGLGKGTAILEGATECSLNSSICCGRRMA